MEDSAGANGERSIELSGRIVLECKRCGERVILLGCAEDWHQEGRTSIGCSGCGEELNLPRDQADEAALAVKDLLRNGIRRGPSAAPPDAAH